MNETPRDRRSAGRLTACVAVPMLVAVSLLAMPGVARAQNPTTDSLRVQIRLLMRQVDSLRAALARIETVGARPDTAADPLARIRAAAAAAAADTAAPQQPAATEFVSRQRNLSALNPEISVSGDVFAFSRSDASAEDNFSAREFEISLVSNLDPYSRAKVFVAHHAPGGEIAPFGDAHDGEGEEGHGSEVDIEEGYVEWVGLPGGLNVSVGKFRQRFGKLNRWHAHALPAQQYPLPIQAFMGEEGLGQAGVSVHWLTPLHGFGTYEVWGEVTRNDNGTLFGESRGMSALAHLNAFWDVSPSTYLEIGFSGLTGGYGPGSVTAAPGEFVPTRNRLFGADFTLDWRPPEQAKYRQATLHGSLMVNRRSGAGEHRQALGGFLIGEYKLAAQWILGGRYEYTENPDEPDVHASLAGPSLTWWQSEYVRLRTAWEFYRGPEHRFNQLVLQATFAMGPHKHENY